MPKKILLINLPQAELGQSLACACADVDAAAWEQALEFDSVEVEVETLDAESQALNFFAIVRAIRRRAPELVVFHHTRALASVSLPVGGFAGLLMRYLQQLMPKIRVELMSGSSLVLSSDSSALAHSTTMSPI